jgi:hypothetical protein
MRSIHAAAAAVIILALPGLAGAQSVGLGPRLSWVRGDVEVDADTSGSRYTGGLLRARLSPRTAIELSLDYRSITNEALTERVRDYPIQGSLLLYPFRSAVSPYLLGGLGWYSQRVDAIVDQEVTDSVTTRKFGYHAGLGGELRLGRHAAMHVDYRYTFIRIGGDEESEMAGTPAAARAASASSDGFRLPGLSFLTDRLRLSHEGSMWTGGLTIYF